MSQEDDDKLVTNVRLSYNQLCVVCFGHGKIAPSNEQCFACNGGGEITIVELHFWREQINILRSGIGILNPRWPQNQPLPDLKPWLGMSHFVDQAIEFEFEYEKKLEGIPKRYAPIIDWGKLYNLAPESIREAVHVSVDDLRVREDDEDFPPVLAAEFCWPENQPLPEVRPWLGPPAMTERAVKLALVYDDSLEGIPRRYVRVVDWWKLYEMAPESVRMEVSFEDDDVNEDLRWYFTTEEARLLLTLKQLWKKDESIEMCFGLFVLAFYEYVCPEVEVGGDVESKPKVEKFEEESKVVESDLRVEEIQDGGKGSKPKLEESEPRVDEIPDGGKGAESKVKKLEEELKLEESEPKVKEIQDGGKGAESKVKTLEEELKLEESEPKVKEIQDGEAGAESKPKVDEIKCDIKLTYSGLATVIIKSLKKRNAEMTMFWNDKNSIEMLGFMEHIKKTMK